MTSSFILISEDLIEDMFDISFTVIRHGISPNTGLLRMTPSEVFHSPFTMSCEELIQDIPTFLRTNVANYLSENDVGILASEIISYYQEVIQRTTIRTSHHRLIPLIVYIHVNTSSDHSLVPTSFHLQTTALHAHNEYMMILTDDDDHESVEIYDVIDPSIPQSFDHDDEHMDTSEDPESSEINQVLEQSMQHHLFIFPASEKAIASFKKMKMSDDEMKASQCSICLENFEDEDGDGDGDDDDVLALPCDHYFHNNCIVNWLRTGHTCPLCRFELPME